MPGLPLLDEPAFRTAVANLETRAERQVDDEHIVATYVEPGIEAFYGRSNQILYGRRGTGKTHVLKVLQARARHAEQQLAVYIDMRGLGNSATFRNSAEIQAVRETSLLKDVLDAVLAAMKTEISTETAGGPAERAITDLEFVMSSSVLDDETALKERETSADRDARVSAGVGLSLTPKVEISTARHDSTHEKVVTQGKPLDRIDFPTLNRALSVAISELDLNRLYVLLDEWSSVPRDLQPLLAEFLRRSFFANNRITVKIATLEYESSFYRRERASAIGIQPGTDVAAALYLDESYVYDRFPERVRELFCRLLYNHLAAQLAWDSYLDALRMTADAATQQVTETRGLFRRVKTSQVSGATARAHYPPSHQPRVRSDGTASGAEFSEQWAPYHMRSKYNIDTPERLVKVLFAASGNSFMELVKAAEGVPRDFIHIFTRAYAEAHSRNAQRLNRPAVVKAATDWYHKEKSAAVQGDVARNLNQIINDTLKGKKLRTFLVPRDLEYHPVLDELVHLRVVHLIERPWIDEADPAGTYSLYTLDYGAYVLLLETKNEPLDAAPLRPPGPATKRLPAENTRTRLRRPVLSRETLDGCAPLAPSDD